MTRLRLGTRGEMLGIAAAEALLERLGIETLSGTAWAESASVTERGP